MSARQAISPRAVVLATVGQQIAYLTTDTGGRQCMDGDSSERSVMGCLMARRLQLVRELRGMRLAALPGRWEQQGIQGRPPHRRILPTRPRGPPLTGDERLEPECE